MHADVDLNHHANLPTGRTSRSGELCRNRRTVHRNDDVGPGRRLHERIELVLADHLVCHEDPIDSRLGHLERFPGRCGGDPNSAGINLESRHLRTLVRLGMRSNVGVIATPGAHFGHVLPKHIEI